MRTIIFGVFIGFLLAAALGQAAPRQHLETHVSGWMMCVPWDGLGPIEGSVRYVVHKATGQVVAQERDPLRPMLSAANRTRLDTITKAAWEDTHALKLGGLPTPTPGTPTPTPTLSPLPTATP